MRRRLIVTIGLELYALLLAAWQAMGGVRTDEAKYLLNIPYPHPPLGRFILHAFEWLPFQEIFWRVLLATLLIQLVWIVWDMGKGLSREARWVLAAAWLFSGGVLLQVGSIMMAPLTAAEGLLLLWMHSKNRNDDAFLFWAAVLWLATLFTAYQGFLFLPVAVAIFNKRTSVSRTLLFVGVPVILLALYTLANPLALASIVVHNTTEVQASLGARLHQVLMTWLVAGSLLVSVLGTFGLLRSRDWALVATFALLALYMVPVGHRYYAVLFVPVFVAGLVSLLKDRPPSTGLLPTIVVSGIAMALLFPLTSVMSPARRTLALIPASLFGDVLIRGSYGHEWQYESTRRILSMSLRPVAIVCLDDCSDIPKEGFTRVENAPEELWIKE